MRVQLQSRIMLSVDISAIITDILPWFTVDVGELSVHKDTVMAP